MGNAVVQSGAPVTLVGAGPVGQSDLSLALPLAPRIVAVDGGVAPVLAAGHTPEAVMGDFDSLPDTAVLSALPPDCFHPTPDQNFTDFEKALRLVEAPVVVGVGFTGGRMDHQLAVFHSLAMCAHRPCILLGETEIVFLCPRQIDLPTAQGDTVSLFPLGRVTGTSTGLEWPIDGLDFAPDQRIGTSNRAQGVCHISVDAAAMLVFVPRRLLPEVTQALQTQPPSARWSAL